MSWKEQPLEEIANCELGKMLDKNKNKGEYEPYLSNVDVRWGYFELDDLKKMRFESREFERYSLKAGDIIMCEGGEAGRCAVWQETTPKMMYQKALHRIRPLDGVESKFLYYTFLNMGNQNEIEPYYTGSTIKHLPLQILKKIPIKIAPLETQKRIASILSAYDDLIENNLKRIKLLEETAQNIYKEWFVNFRFPNYEHTEFDAESGLPVGWSVDIIGNQLLTIKRNGKLKTDDYELEGKFPIIDQANGFIAGYTNNEEVVQDLHLPIVVFGDHTRRVKFVNFPFVSGADGTQLMFPKNENLLPAYFYLSINNIDLSNYAYARHYKFMKEQPIIIPDEKTLGEFNKKAYPLLEQTIHLLNYNQKLKEARDILLPRLMNRTIEV
jgi:type I restriction enzyme S subunit